MGKGLIAALVALLWVGVTQAQAQQQPSPEQRQQQLQQEREKVWEQNETVLPMDDPPLPWFAYTKDGQGRSTYLPQDCVALVHDHFLKTGELYDVCMVSGADEHKRAVARHAAEVAAAAAAAAEAAQRAYAASPAGQAEARARQAQALAAALASREDEIRSVYANQLYLAQYIADEKNAARVSGYMHRSAVQSAAVAFEQDERQIRALYADYRSAGGRKTLAQIYAGAR